MTKSYLTLSIILCALFSGELFAYDNDYGNGNDYGNNGNNGNNGNDDDDEKRKRKNCRNNLRISTQDDLRFGKFAVASPGSVKVDTNGIATTSGGIYFLDGDTSNARFKVEGCRGDHYNISLPDSTSLRKRRSNGEMTLDTFTSQPAGSGQLNHSGYQYVQVGGTLHANWGQRAGRYRGQFEVYVDLTHE